MTRKKAYLILENEAVFEGISLGKEKDIIGRLVFNTDMYGHETTLLNPALYGNICLFTFPLIGNTGISDNDFNNSKCFLSGVILNEYCESPSNFMSAHTLDEYLERNHVCGISGVDTRHVMNILRQYGSMNAMISQTPPTTDTFNLIKQHAIQNAIASCSTKKIIEHFIPMPKHNVLLIDYGSKDEIVKELNDRMCNVTCFPYDAMDEEIFDYGADGIVLSDGPFDIKAHDQLIHTIKEIIGKKPVFATGLSHLLLAIALGYEIEKQKVLQGGSNYPVIDVSNNRIFITCMHHTHNVTKKDEYDKNIYLVNTVDKSIAAMNYINEFAISCQFVPKTHPGPRNTGYLYDRFIKMMEEHKNA